MQVSQCRTLTRATFDCPALQLLRLAWLGRFTDAGLVEALSKTPQLQVRMLLYVLLCGVASKCTSDAASVLLCLVARWLGARTVTAAASGSGQPARTERHYSYSGTKIGERGLYCHTLTCLIVDTRCAATDTVGSGAL